MESEIFESQEDDETADDGRKVTNGIELSEPATILALVSQFHAYGRSDGHIKMLSQAQDEQPGQHHPITGGGKPKQQRTDRAKNHGRHSEAARTQDPQGGGNKHHQKSRHLARKFEEGTLKTGQLKIEFKKIIEG